jgi:hypothetical protein
VTAQLLREYKEMINNTTLDLQEILEQAKNKLGDYTLQTGSPSPKDPNDINRLAIEEERVSVEHCLNVSKDVESHLEKVRAEISISTAIRDDSDTPNLLRRDKAKPTYLRAKN